ncbi:MAG TPA: glycosyltransferase family 2 protein, partial [Opitutales bacterium]|nr:glycosyltransferase family 2 protein [Opitutales bacterium]
PSYNTGGALLAATVDDVLAASVCDVIVFIDGSDDDSAAVLYARYSGNGRVRVMASPENRGKGRAVVDAAKAALKAGYTHACVFDSDGQHAAADIDRFFRIAAADESALVMGVPIFGPDAPPERVKGRRVGNTFAKIETLWLGPEDSLYGMRIYPLAALVDAMSGLWRSFRFEFDTEAAVRMVWAGARPVNVRTSVRYPPKDEGGVTHFKYLQDNLRLIVLHTRLLIETPFRVPGFLLRRRRADHQHGKDAA